MELFGRNRRYQLFTQWTAVVPSNWVEFDNSRAMFVRDPVGNWVYNLLDQGLCNVQLIDKFIELESASSDPSKVREVGASVNCYRFSFCVWCMSL